MTMSRWIGLVEVVGSVIRQLWNGMLFLALVFLPCDIDAQAQSRRAVDQKANASAKSAPATITSAGRGASEVAERMRFDGRPPDPKLIFLAGNAWTIYASGPIDAEAGKRLEAYLAANRVPMQSHFYFDSPGGSLLAGMELGRVIRKHELRTNVGAARVDNLTGHSAGPGGCFSSCALAFLGGKFRFLNKDARYGVHRFSFKTPVASAVDVAQVASAAIVQYLRDMDVDTGLFTLASSVGESEIFEPTQSQLTTLNVVNNGFTRPVWTIESAPNGEGIYLKGERDTVFGMNKFMLLCDSKIILLYAIFDPQQREAEVLTFPVDYLVVDGRQERIDQARIFRKEVRGWINASYKLTTAQVTAISRAHTVGVAMMPREDSPAFLGFDSMPVDAGTAKIRGFIQACK
ncbi:hypothetical protein IVA80_35430 [Bradyrhizobium sp. 139]|uniref:COG3904 family protein n=1 Tax=Bradyrhizobium sp. 139 TaxID=2782616 RepID=UPI001FF9DEEF|nr:hypothetical protein [Bradyrhizobium sp. 139]MCK1745917.1 hypothetical protein [Bradyrhizobium sp. 139]